MSSGVNVAPPAETDGGQTIGGIHSVVETLIGARIEDLFCYKRQCFMCFLGATLLSDVFPVADM